MLNCPRLGTAHDGGSAGPPGTGGAGARKDGKGNYLYADGTNIGCGGSAGLPPGKGYDTTRLHPWRAPGTAKITSPCGVDGGNPRGCTPETGTKGCMPGGYGHGPDGRTLMHQGLVTTWRRGSVVEAKWTIGANHNGGYAYRLCKKPADPAQLTEECTSSRPTPASKPLWLSRLFVRRFPADAPELFRHDPVDGAVRRQRLGAGGHPQGVPRHDNLGRDTPARLSVAAESDPLLRLSLLSRRSAPLPPAFLRFLGSKVFFQRQSYRVGLNMRAWRLLRLLLRHDVPAASRPELDRAAGPYAAHGLR